MSFTVRKESRRHVGGTKDYHLVAITNTRTGNHLFVQRWAKAGQWGNGIKITRCDGTGLDRAWAEVAGQKFRRDEYAIELPAKGGSYDTVEELQKALGQYWVKLGAHLEWLIPGVGMDGAPVEPERVWDEEKRAFVRVESPTEGAEFVDPDEAKKAAAAEAKAMEQNPAWGSW